MILGANGICVFEMELLKPHCWKASRLSCLVGLGITPHFTLHFLVTLRGGSRIMDLALDLWESTNRVFCEKLEEGFKAVVCGTISKQALQRAGETSKKNG